MHASIRPMLLEIWRIVPILSLFDSDSCLYAGGIGAALTDSTDRAQPSHPLTRRALPMSWLTARTPKERELMKIFLCASVTLLAFSTAAFGQRPAIYPLRSQNPAAQGVDSAYCYWQAKQQTGIDMTRLPQRPPRTKVARFAPDAGRGASQPPLPGAAAGPSARPGNAGAATAASGNAGALGGASPAAGRPGAASPSASSPSPSSSSAHAAVAPGSGVSAPASEPVAASGTPATSVASASGPAAANSAASANLPPLPPPEPPMTTYWHAYGDCMQARGYGVQ